MVANANACGHLRTNPSRLHAALAPCNASAVCSGSDYRIKGFRYA